MIPSVAECFELMDQYRMLANIRTHSLVVARVTECLARSLQRLGHHVSLEIAVAGALLHDIAKTQCLESTANHAREGRKICARHRFDEVADIVGEHIRLAGGVTPGGYPEKEIVFYADKRVNHERIVSLDERLAYILDRYGREHQPRRQAILENFEQCRQVEAKVFGGLDFGPEELGRRTRELDSDFPELELI
jgi:uncharacterized protein